MASLKKCPPKPNCAEENCAAERGMRILGGRWTSSIMWHLRPGGVRFNELARQLPSASKKMITQRLRELEENGLVAREVLSTKPIAVAYSLTPFGCSATGIMDEVAAWVEREGL